MKFNRYLITLLAIPVLLFSAKAYSKNISSDDPPLVKETKRAFLVEDHRADGQMIVVNGFSSKNKLSGVADDLDVLLYPEDKISIFPEMYLEMGGKITINQAPRINLADGKKQTLYRSWVGTVGELLAEKGIVLGVDDKITPSLDATLSDMASIKINRVAKTTIVEAKVVKFKTIKKSDPNLEKGNKRVEVAGVNGSNDYYYEVTRIDGEEVSRRLLETKTSKEVVDEVLVVGTKVVVYGTGKATWYTRTNEMIAAHNSLPRGTKVTVANLNNGKKVTVTIVGGGISHSDNVIIDLSTAAFQALGATLGTGKLENIRIEKYYSED